MEYILSLAKEYETRTDLNLIDRFRLQDDLEGAITTYLNTWVTEIPENTKALYGDRLERAIHYITSRKLQLDHIWLNANEICVKCPYLTEAEMYISVSPSHILIRDTRPAMKEMAFPFSRLPLTT